MEGLRVDRACVWTTDKKGSNHTTADFNRITESTPDLGAMLRQFENLQERLGYQSYQG
jgi:hypothetical protein